MHNHMLGVSKKTKKPIKQKKSEKKSKKPNREKKPIKNLKKSIGSIQFQFYNPEIKKTKPKLIDLNRFEFIF